MNAGVPLDLAFEGGSLGARLIGRREARRGGIILLFPPGGSDAVQASDLAGLLAEGGWDALLLPLGQVSQARQSVETCAASLEEPVFLLGCGGAAATAASISQITPRIAGTVCLPGGAEVLMPPSGDLAAPLLLHQPRAQSVANERPPQEGLSEFVYEPAEMGDWMGASDTARLALLRTRQFLHRLAGFRETGT